METARKFMFGADFREGGRRAAGEADLAAAKAEGFRAGESQGRRASDSLAAGLLAQLAASAERLIAQDEARMAEIETQAARLAIATARGLAEAALAEKPTAALERAVRECFGHARQAPHLAVRVEAGAVETVEAMLARLARETGFAGRIVVLGDPDIAVGDGRIEWADGGLAIDNARIGRLIAQAVRSVFGEHAGFDGPEKDAS